MAWDCLLDHAEVGGAIFVEVPTHLFVPEFAMSGETTLYGPGMSVVDGRAIAFPSSSTPVFGQSNNNAAQVRTRRLSATGTRLVVVVRVSCGSRKPGIKTLAQLKSDVFSDSSCLKTNIAFCSNHTLNIVPGPLDGGIDVNIPFKECENFAEPSSDAIYTAIRAVQTQLRDKSPSSLEDSHFMYCVPEPATDDKRIAYGYINGWM